MSRPCLLALALVAGLLLASCSLVSAADRSQAGPLVVVLFDVSQSTRAPRIRDGYLETFDRVVDAVASREGTVVGDVIDANPLAHSTYPIHATFGGCDPFRENRLVCEARTTELRDDLGAAAEALLRSGGRPRGTDVAGGIRLAERVFTAYPETGDRSLVILSDMVDHSSRAILGGADVPSGDVQARLEALDREGSIPDLTGVAVYVVGAGVVSGEELAPERILGLERYWQGYFERAGVTWRPERYGAALVRFP
jgi:hypothetical protein